ncbi:MAG: extracellular solute-binding protein [Kiloniellales bacterium]|nr:extracellular solute-binding protein [Kiloniellales bacterium]
MERTRKLLRAGVFVGSLVAASGVMQFSAVAGEFDGVTLRVGTWGGSWKANIEERIVPKFEALGGKIEFVTGSPQANLAKVITGRGKAPFDVMEILDAQVADMLESGFLQQVDLDKIPNTRHVESFQYNENMVGSWHTQEVICYHVDKFKEMGIPVPTTYADLIRPELAGKVSFPDINSGGGLANFTAVNIAAGGDKDNVMPGLELINKMQVLKFWSRGGETLSQFQSGDIVAAISNGGWCLRTRKAGVNVDSVHPDLGNGNVGVAKVGWLGIMKSSEDKNVDAAHWFINEYLEEDFQLLFATKSGIIPINKGAIERMHEDEVIRDILVLDQAKIANELRFDYAGVNLSDWTDQWNRMVAR